MQRLTPGLRILIPAIVFLTVGGVFAVLSRVVRDRARSEIALRTDLTAEQVATRIGEQITFRVDLLNKLRYDWSRGRISSPESFAEHVEATLFETVGLSSVNWIDESGIIRWTAPQERHSTIGRSILENATAAPVFREALESGQWRITPMLDLHQGGRGVVAYIPVVSDERSRGAFSGTLDVTTLIDSCLEPGVRGNFRCEVRDREELIYGGGGEQQAADSSGPFPQTQRVMIGGRVWEATLFPRPVMVAGELATASPLIIAIGLLVAAGLALVSARLIASQAQLKDNEERLRAVAEHVPGVIYSYDSSPGKPRVLIYLGPGLDLILGPESAARVAKNFDLLFELLHPDDRAGVSVAANRGAKEGGTVDCEARLRTDDGSYRWVRSLSRPMPVDRERTRWHIVLIDITEHRRTVNALRESEERYRILVESSPVGVLIHRNETLQFVNPSAARLLGYDRPDDLVGRSLYDCVPVEHHDVVRGRIARLDGLTSPARYDDERLRRRDGSELNVEIIANTIQFGGSAARQILFLDMTEQRQVEKRQRLLMQELDHRVKNNLASVLALLDQTAATTRDIDEFRSKFTARIKAMARTHEMLARAKWSGVDLADIIRLSIAPYIVEQNHRVQLDGSSLTIRPRPALPIGLALHELATNAIRHGSLSTPDGRIGISWARENGRISLRWTETGGPGVNSPEDFGTGLRLVRGLIEFELGGAVDFDFNSTGLACTLSIEAATLTGESQT